MRSLSERQTLVLELLRESGKSLTGADLSSLLGISPRTLRNDITRINRLAREPIINADSSGYQIHRDAYQELLRGGEIEESSTDNRLLIFLLNHPSTDIYEVAMACYQSEGSVKPAIERLTGKLKQYRLEIVTRGPRIELGGTELDKRRILGYLIGNALDSSRSNLAELLPEVDLSGVQQVLEIALVDSDQQLDDITEQNLVINIAIALQRSSHNEELAELAAKSPIPPEAERVLTGLRTAGYPLTESSEVVITRLVSIALQNIAGASITSHQDVQDVVAGAVDTCIQRFDLVTQRDKLVDSLTQHTLRLIARRDTFAIFRNGLRDSLRTMSPFIFDIAVYLAHDVCSRLNLEITDDEISLFAIYLGLYTSNSDRSPNAITATIVCPRYQILREWLLTRLVEIFGDRLDIVDVVATLAEATATETELIISTVGTNGEQRVVPISALCSELDIDSIESSIVRATERSERNQITRTLGRFLSSELFFVDHQFLDADQTIDFLGGKLVAQGRVPDDYIASVKVREGYSSTAFAPRFAVPHSMDFIANQTSIAVLIPKAPINWGELDVVLVLMLAINPDDYEDFSFFYQQLIRQLCRPDVLSRLRQIREFEPFREFLAAKMVSSTEAETN